MRRIKSRTITFTLLFGGLFIIADAFAISPDNHRSLTRTAVTAYKNCTQQLGVIDSLDEGIETIIMLSGLEDESPLISRYFNWHFFDAYKDKETAMGRSITGARKSIHHIYDERADSLIKALTNKQKDDVYEYTGRLLHHIQDMTVPAHVAPIFHYKFLWFDRSDYFDEMPEWSTSSFTPSAGLCHFKGIDIDNLKQRFNTILNKTAHGTRNRITQQIPVKDDHPLKGKTWEEFWVLRNPDDDHKYTDTKSGFAPYGNQGREGFEKLCKGTSADREVCLAFFKQSFNSSIFSTVETLLLINHINLRYSISSP